MPRPIPVLIEELRSTLTELWHAFSSSKLADKRLTDARTRQRRSKAAAVTSASASDTAVRNRSAVMPKKRSKASSAKRVLQGKYMTAVRDLSTRAKAEVKKVRAEQGVDAAIKLALSKRK